jgi:hypothetical protein
MHFPKYFVTYCVMDTDAGANPFGHACLIFSRQEKDKAPVEVIDSLGFYSQPSTTTNPFINFLKSIFGLTIDLQDGHGIIKQEQMRWLDNKGLHGISFEVPEAQFDNLYKRYYTLMLGEDEVVAELNAELAAQNIEANGFTRFNAEKAKAAAEGRAPRLKPFHLTVDFFTLHGPDSSESYTCKSHALDLLTECQIISEELKSQLNSNDASKAFPAFSDIPLHPLTLVSTGIPQTISSKKTGKFFYNHVWDKNTLYWASPVNLIDKKPAFIEESLKEMLYRIQRIEYRLYETLRHAKNDEPENKEYHAALNKQLQRVQNVAFLFHNADENQNATLLNARLKNADEVLNVASLVMSQEQLNSSFLLRAWESIALHEALLGLLVMAVSAATLLTTPLGIGLFITGATMAAYQGYTFYTEERKHSETKELYETEQAMRMV